MSLNLLTIPNHIFVEKILSTRIRYEQNESLVRNYEKNDISLKTSYSDKILIEKLCQGQKALQSASHNIELHK